MTWHNCDGKIGELLQKALTPPQDFNGGVPTWFILVWHRSAAVPLSVSHCPVCGEPLPPVEDCLQLGRIYATNAATLERTAS